jgi:hypothetical protein
MAAASPCVVVPSGFRCAPFVPSGLTRFVFVRPGFFVFVASGFFVFVASGFSRKTGCS